MGHVLIAKDILYLHTKDEARQLAKKLQEYGGTESEREVKEARERHIHEKILSPEVMPFKWVIAHVPSENIAARFNGDGVEKSTNVKEVFRDLTQQEWEEVETKRENGSHSSRVVLRLTDEEWKHVRLPLIVDWEAYACDTRKDQAYLFEQFDPPWSARSKEDYIGAHLAINETLYTRLNRHLATAAINGLTWYMTKVEKDTAIAARPTELVYANHDVQPFLLWFGTVAQKGITTHLFNQPVIAAMYHTTRGGQDKAQLFWRDVARGYSALPEGSLAYKLSMFLDNVKNHHFEWKDIKRQLKQSQFKPNDRDIFGTCLRAVSTAVKDGNLETIFAPAGKKNAAQIAQMIYPLPDTLQEA